MIIEEGSLGRVTEDFEYEGRTIYAGEVVTIEEYMPPTDEPDYYSHAYYASYRGGMNNLVVPADAVELAMTEEEAGKREAPSADDIARELVSAIGNSYGDEWFVRQAEYTCEGEVQVEAETNEGLGFYFTVSVSGVEQGEVW